MGMHLGSTPWTRPLKLIFVFIVNLVVATATFAQTDIRSALGKGFEKSNRSAKLRQSVKSNLQAESNLEIAADNISRDFDTKTLVLEGHVHIGFGAEKLDCDKAKVDLKATTISAEGHVTLEGPETFVGGEKIVYNYSTKLGEITKGSVESGNVIFVGDLIKKNSETNYLAINASFSACATCPEAWSFSGTEIEAEMGGYAYIKYPILHIVDFPVLILPRLLVPLKSTRQSGLLVPSFSYSANGGSEFGLPYFWAISKNQDATFTLRNYARRGLKEQLEYRYVLSEGSRGQLHSGFIHDQAFTESGISSGATKSLDRGFLLYEHLFSLPNGYIQRTNLNYISDTRYPRDFYEEVPGLGNSAMETSVSITKNFNSQHLSLEGDYYTTLLTPDSFINNNDSVHRLPELNYSFIEHQVGDTHFFFRMDFNYTNFERRNYSYDEAYLNGSNVRTLTPASSLRGYFDPATDQIRTGQRMIFAPRLSYPFHLGQFIDVEPAILFQDMEYKFDAKPPTPSANYSDSAERRFIETDISFKTKYNAIYGVDDGQSNRYKHEIEPEVIYSKIPWVQKPDNVFFGNFQRQPYWRKNEAVSNNDFISASRVQFDYEDRYFDKDLATFVLSNYLTRKHYHTTGEGNLEPDYFKFLTFRLAQSYDINEAKLQNPHPWSTVNGLLDVRLNNFETHMTADYYPYASVLNQTLRAKIISDMKTYVELTFADNVIVDETTNEPTNQHTKEYGVGLGFKSKYVEFVGRRVISLISQAVQVWEYNANLKFPGDCLVLRFGQTQQIGSDVKFNATLNLNFGG
jgi:LPS-assembly protein